MTFRIMLFTIFQVWQVARKELYTERSHALSYIDIEDVKFCSKLLNRW